MNRRIKTGIVGCGTIGCQLGIFIDKELREYFDLVALCDLDIGKAKSLVGKLKSKPKILDLDNLCRNSQLIIESASISAAEEIIKKTKNTQKRLIILSSGVFVNNPQFIRLSNTQIFIPSGAISGIDGIASFSMGRIRKLRLVTSKPPSSLQGAPFIKKMKIDLSKLRKEKIIFKGSINKAIEHFPQNINVASTLLLASRYKDMEVIIKVNPHLKNNTHRIEAESNIGKLTVELANIPSEDNPKTSLVTIFSTEVLLRKMVENIKVGS
ncbi:MAG: DUF108 domain-containing protein [Candidatus Omnitrophica bacterium]|nr:DUF108 domain-containing protein [Candidatus Omnitrophota bacterium]MCM8825985.1 DUF108 domain-containing protein [Candidatus Omnitrophota bacterium]